MASLETSPYRSQYDVTSSVQCTAQNLTVWYDLEHQAGGCLVWCPYYIELFPNVISLGYDFYKCDNYKIGLKSVNMLLPMNEA